MLNIEKYAEELRKTGTSFALTKQGKPVECDGFPCINCAFNFSCTIKRMNWLLEEYKEPILDDIEKEYLSAVIKPFKNRVKSINKIVYHNDLAFIRLTFDENDLVYFPKFRLKSGMYKGMKNNKEYTLEDLGL